MCLTYNLSCHCPKRRRPTQVVKGQTQCRKVNSTEPSKNMEQKGNMQADPFKRLIASLIGIISQGMPNAILLLGRPKTTG